MAFTPSERRASTAETSMVTRPVPTMTSVTVYEVLKTGSKRARRKTPSFTMVAECR
jgi:hypothetical protein